MRFLTILFALLLIASPAPGFADQPQIFSKPGVAAAMAKSIMAKLKPWQEPLAVRITPAEVAIAVLGTDTRSIVWHRAKTVRNKSLLGAVVGMTRLEISGPEQAGDDEATGQRSFSLADIPLDQIPQTIQKAFQPFGVSAPDVKDIHIARRGHWSAKSDGPLRMLVRATTPDGSLEVLTGADGAVIGANLNRLGGDRRLRLFEQDWSFRIAQEELALGVPAGKTVREITITPDDVSLVADAASGPAKSERWRWSMAGVQRGGNAIDIDVLMKRETPRFRFEQARIAHAPDLITAARNALNVPDGRFGGMTIRRPETGRDEVIHEVTLFYPDKEKGTARFDSAGKLLSTEVPEWRRPAESRTLSAIYERTLKDLEQEFGADVRIVHIDLRDDGSGVFTLEDPRNKGVMVQYIMNRPGVFEPFGSVGPDKELANAFKIRDFNHINGVGITNASRMVLRELAGKAQRVERLMISRATPFNRAKNNAVMMEFRTTDTTGMKAGWIILDVVEGKKVSIVKPD